MTNESSEKENKNMNEIFQKAALLFQEQANKPHTLVTDYSDGLNDGFLGGAIWGHKHAIDMLLSREAFEYWLKLSSGQIVEGMIITPNKNDWATWLLSRMEQK